MNIGQEFVDAIKAREYLRDKTKNPRRINKRKLSIYVRNMRNGVWQPDSLILLNNKGQLLDGQHRLQAVINSNKPQYFLVRHDAPNEVIEVVDSGLPRAVHHRAQLPRKITSIINAINQYTPEGHGKIHSTLTPDEHRIFKNKFQKEINILYSLEDEGFKISQLDTTLASVCIRALYKENHSLEIMKAVYDICTFYTSGEPASHWSNLQRRCMIRFRDRFKASSKSGRRSESARRVLEAEHHLQMLYENRSVNKVNIYTNMRYFTIHLRSEK